MHDYFDILGLSREARATEIRHVWARHARRWHPDFHAQAGDTRPATLMSPAGDLRDKDAAIDFVDMVPVVERMLASFFANE